MLVLTRRIDESIVIQDNIVVTVLAVEGDKVKIGISAPREVSILRHELWQAMKEQARIAESLAAGKEPEGFDKLRNFLKEETSSNGQAGEAPPKPDGGSD
jgi:carbon storage regulator